MTSKIEIFDGHFHLAGFDHIYLSLKFVLEHAALYGVQYLLVFGMPIALVWDPTRPNPLYYTGGIPTRLAEFTDWFVIHKYKQLSRQAQQRIRLGLCGIDLTDLNNTRIIERFLRAHPDIEISIIGECFLYKDDLLPPRSQAHPLHPAARNLYDLCANLGIPILLHCDAGNSVDPTAYLDEFFKAVRLHSRTEFIIAHGFSNRRLELPNIERIWGGALAKLPNLTIELSWRPAIERHLFKAPNAPNPAVLKVVEQYPDRFIIGTDTAGNMNAYADTIAFYRLWLDYLSDPTAQMVAHLNLKRLLCC